jgi:hypothetical protein
VSTCEPLHVPPGTPNVRWSDRWVALIVVGDPDCTPDAPLHLRQHTDEYGAVTTVCLEHGRAVNLTGSYEDGHPVVGCRKCLDALTAAGRRKHLL